MQRREKRRERKDAVSRKWKRIAVEGREKVKGRESVKAAARGEGRTGGCWQSMLLIRKARPLLWDQPSSGVHAESSRRIKRKERKRAEG